MTEIVKEIQKLVDQMKINETFNAEAADHFNRAVERVEKLEEQLIAKDKEVEKLKKELQYRDSDLRNTRERRDVAEKKLNEYKRREKEIERQELYIDMKNLEVQCANQRTEDHKEMMRTVFKNVEVRRNIFTSTNKDSPVTDETGYTKYRESENTTVSVEEKQEFE